jgi:hypothetical protein
MIQPTLQNTWEGRVCGNQIGELVQTQDPAFLLLQGQQLKEFTPRLRYNSRSQAYFDITEHLVNLLLFGCLDGLAIQPLMPHEPANQQARFSYASPTEDYGQAASGGRRIQFLELELTIREREFHQEIVTLIHYDCQS